MTFFRFNRFWLRNSLINDSHVPYRAGFSNAELLLPV